LCDAKFTVKRFEEIQQKIKMGQVDVPVTKEVSSVGKKAQVAKEETSLEKNSQVATEETSVGKISKVATEETYVGQISKAATEETPVGKISKVAKEETSVGKTSEVAEVETLVGKSSRFAEEKAQVTKEEAMVVRTNIQKVKTPSSGAKNVKSFSMMDDKESDVANDALSKTVVKKKTEKAPKTTTRIDRDDSSMKIVLRSDEQSEDTETTSTTSTSFAPDYESALRVGGDEEADDDDDD
jgi:hypothetical protein